jgi:hypothetical protein
MSPAEAQQAYLDILDLYNEIKEIPDPYVRAIQHKLVFEGLEGRALTPEQAAEEVARDQAENGRFGEYLETLSEEDQSVAMQLRFATMTYGPDHQCVKDLEARLRHEQVVEPSPPTAPAPPVYEPPLPMLEGPKLHAAAWGQLGKEGYDR